ncbi:uncharacterized protein [Haliotis cracherodii]|uniref:protein PLANT CADMIUM RESISTANCE 1-like n=1 Tax=Haliotis rufescens TaxID=6454 RepID=UPI001EB04418|nr:protein PLANT CADMIUM RESISTANCE 1-like [Haliotis rufescens]
MGEWQHGLCGCFDNFGICIITYFVPCVTAGRNAEAVGESCCLYGFLSMTCVGLWSMTMVRGKIRQAKGIEGSCIGDCVLIMFCTLCTLVQEGQEVEGMAQQSIARE